MSRHGLKKLIKRPKGAIGSTVLTISLIGILLAAGNLVSLRQIPEQLITQSTEQWAARLKSSGLPEPIVNQFRAQLSIAEDRLAELSDDQKQALELAGQNISSVMQATSQAVEISRRKTTRWMGFFLIGIIVGGAFVGFAARQPEPLENQ